MGECRAKEPQRNRVVLHMIWCSSLHEFPVLQKNPEVMTIRFPPTKHSTSIAPQWNGGLRRCLFFWWSSGTGLVSWSVLTCYHRDYPRWCPMWTCITLVNCSADARMQQWFECCCWMIWLLNIGWIFGFIFCLSSLFLLFFLQYDICTC